MKRSTLLKRDEFLNIVIVATVIEADKKSTELACGFEVGDKIIFTGTEILGRDKDGKSFPGTLCYSALVPLLSNVFTMEHGGVFPWEQPTCITACPDGTNPIVFELCRYDKKTGEIIPPEEATSHYLPRKQPGDAVKTISKKGTQFIRPPSNSPLGKILAGQA